MGEFPFTALSCVAGDVDIGRPVQLCAPFAPGKGLHFETLHADSFSINIPCISATFVPN